MNKDNEDIRAKNRGDDGRPMYFGKQLRALRETYADRINRTGEALPVRAMPSANSVIACMKKHGYQIGNATFNEIETGLNVPRDAVGFLDTIAICLRLSSEEKRDLGRRLAYDLLWLRLRARTNEVFPPDPDW